MEQKKNWHDRNYKLLLILPAILLILSLVYLFVFYQKNNDVIIKDVSLSGGTSVTIFNETDITSLKQFLSQYFSDFSVREISDLRTGKQIAVIIEIPNEPEAITPLLETYYNFELDGNNSSIEFTGGSIGEGFYTQLRFAIILAFILMSIVIFIIFRTFIPALAVILSAFADIIMSLAVVDLLGIKLSAAGIVAFLMLIGYSVDSDILLTTQVLKRRELSINQRLFSAFKTGMTMTLTSLAAVLVSLFIVFSLSDTLFQIFAILTIGLVFDLFNTWITNISILKWYAINKRLE